MTSSERQGCSIVAIDDVEDNKISVREIIFVDEIGSCAISEAVNHTIPCGNDKIELLSFRKKLYDKIAIEKDNANNLLLLEDEDNGKDFMTLFSYPVLKKDAESNLESRNTPLVSFDDLISMDDNYFILGKDKCGKTSLLRRIQIEHLINFSRNGRIPFYLDAKEYELRIDDKFSIEDLVRNYYSINRGKAKEILSSGFVLLIDNFSPHSGFATYFEEFLDEYPDVKFIACSEENLALTVDMMPFGDASFEKVFFHKLRKQELVQYTDKRLDPNSKKDELIRERIISLCNQLELPLNYWTISLILLIHNKSSESYAKNLFSILMSALMKFSIKNK